MSRERKPVGRSLRSKVAVKAESHKNDRNFSSYLKLPDGITVFKPKKEGNFRFNIIPYVAGKNNRDTDAGELDYEFTFWVHRIGTGEDQKTFVCPKKTYGKPCPLCEQIEKLSKNYVENEDEIKELKAKQRQIFNIQDIRDEEEKIQIYETGYFKAFGEMLDKRLRPMDGDEEEDEDYRDFADIPGGRTLKVLFVEDSFNGHKFFAPSSIDFIDRKEELSDNIVEKAVCLDSCLKVLSYDDILKLIAGTADELKDDDDDEEEEEKPTKKTKPAAPSTSKKKTAPVEDEEEEEDDDDDDDDDDEKEEEKPVKKTKVVVKKAAPVENEDEEEDEEDEDDDDDDDDDEKPVKKSKSATTKKKTAPVEDEEEDDEEEDDEEEEEKPVKKAKPAETKKAAPGEKKKGKCPAGYAFGADCYVYPECDECSMVEECDAAGE